SSRLAIVSSGGGFVSTSPPPPSKCALSSSGSASFVALPRVRCLMQMLRAMAKSQVEKRLSRRNPRMPRAAVSRVSCRTSRAVSSSLQSLRPKRSTRGAWRATSAASASLSPERARSMSVSSESTTMDSRAQNEAPRQELAAPARTTRGIAFPDEEARNPTSGARDGDRDDRNVASVEIQREGDAARGIDHKGRGDALADGVEGHGLADGSKGEGHADAFGAGVHFEAGVRFGAGRGALSVLEPRDHDGAPLVRQERADDAARRLGPLDGDRVSETLEAAAEEQVHRAERRERGLGPMIVEQDPEVTIVVVADHDVARGRVFDLVPGDQGNRWAVEEQ